MPSWGNNQNNGQGVRNDNEMINWDPAVPDAQMPRTLHVNDVNVGNDAKIAIKAVNKSTNAGGRALYTEGQVEMVAGLNDDPGITAVKIYNPSTDVLAYALQVTGKGAVAAVTLANTGDGRALELVGGAKLGDTDIGGSLHVQLGIDNWGPAFDVEIGADEDFSHDVLLSREGRTTHVRGALHVDQAATVEGQMTVGPNNAVGRIDANNNHDLQIGTQAGTDDVVLGKANHNVEVYGNLRVIPPIAALGNVVVGPDDAVGRIDANNTHDLQLGTQAGTDDVAIGRSGKNVEIAAAILDVEGEFRIGSTSSAGKVDSGGSSSSPLNLLLGSQNVTADVQLGRSGKIVDVMGNERVNSNQVIVNGASSLTATGGAGFVFNSLGHGNGASIDFYINGVMVHYLDATGWK